LKKSKISLIICFLAAGITEFPDRAMSFEQASDDFAIAKEETVTTKQFKFSQPVVPSVEKLSMDDNPMGQVNSVKIVPILLPEMA
jgi:hypothetical protein